MAFKKEPNLGMIEFSYTKLSLFNNASLRSTYKSRCMIDQQGNYIGEPYALSDDESDAFEICLEKIMTDIYDTVLKMTSGVTDAFVADSAQVTFKIRDNRGYNENVLKNVDISVKDSIVAGVLREWYDVCAKPDFYAEYALKYQVSVNALRDRLFQLKKKTIE